VIIRNQKLQITINTGSKSVLRCMYNHCKVNTSEL